METLSSGMDAPRAAPDPEPDTFPKLVVRNAERRPHRVAIREKDYGIRQSNTWRDHRDEARLIALGLASLGFARGDKTAIVGDNRPPLLWAMLATQALVTCVCPMTGPPDFATIRIRYVPNQHLVELKLLKLYLWSYRQEGAFHRT